MVGLSVDYGGTTGFHLSFTFVHGVMHGVKVMNRATITLTVEYDGELDSLELVEHVEGALDAYVGLHYSTLQFQNHTIDIEVNDADA